MTKRASGQQSPRRPRFVVDQDQSFVDVTLGEFTHSRSNSEMPPAAIRGFGLPLTRVASRVSFPLPRRRFVSITRISRTISATARPTAREDIRRCEQTAEESLPKVIEAATGAPQRGADILIVIPSLNEQSHIEGVIRSLQADADAIEALIVLADDGSRDDTVAIVERIGMTDPRVIALSTSEPPGVSSSVNRAVERFGHRRRWLVRIDAHADYPANYPSRLVRVAMEHDAAAVVTPMTSRGTTCFQVAAAAAQNSFLGTGGSAHRMVGRRGGWVEHGHHALIALGTFAAVGGYDETFSHNEDAELDHRIIDAGGRIWLENDLSLVYYPRKTLRSLARQYFFYGRGRAMTVARHPGLRRLRQVVPLVIAPSCCLLIISPVFWPIALPAFAWAALCLAYGAVLGIKQGRCAAGAGVAAILMQGAWSFGYWSQVLFGHRPGGPPAVIEMRNQPGVGVAAS